MKTYYGRKVEGKHLVDLTGNYCHNCGIGVYCETSQNDDANGVLHCDECGDEQKRWQNYSERRNA